MSLKESKYHLQDWPYPFPVHIAPSIFFVSHHDLMGLVKVPTGHLWPEVVDQVIPFAVNAEKEPLQPSQKPVSWQFDVDLLVYFSHQRKMLQHVQNGHDPVGCRDQGYQPIETERRQGASLDHYWDNCCPVCCARDGLRPRLACWK